MTKEEKLIEENNVLREKLTSENKEYYEKILIYIRTKSLFRAELDIELILIELLNDILEAQSNGESAEKYFGENPQPMLDKLLDQLPKIATNKKVTLVLMIFGISSLFSLFSSLTRINPSINVLTLILNGLISLAFVKLIFWMINQFTFKPNTKKKKEYSIVFLISFLFIGLTFVSNYLGSLWLSISVPSMTGLVITWSGLVIYSLWVLLKKKREYYYSIVSLALLNLIPTIQYIPSAKVLLATNTNKTIFIVLILVLIYGSMYLNFKKTK
ncbi:MULTISPECIES: DUF1129 family protein [Vagococcus]|uniref:Integral membrane protein n=1 Tax=Vagococcus fluvialis bH819 TaxID=1255619 RepID=A0A1X6WMT0_9ENTE|nr:MULTISPECIES: DUF1129 family protein [Vagococcus]SLM85575.1 hypothetical protein FM121_05705 [Vagococcus fluvialis bH819]HCM89544.1 DUF1129 domain-containing protein [Vagococcus sp.]